MSKTPDRLLHRGEFLKVNVPDLFENPAFVKFLNDPENNMATWHQKGEWPHEYSDCFVTYDAGEGSHSNMPDECWDLLCKIVEQHMGRPDVYVILHLTNLDV